MKYRFVDRITPLGASTHDPRHQGGVVRRVPSLKSDGRRILTFRKACSSRACSNWGHRGSVSSPRGFFRRWAFVVRLEEVRFQKSLRPGGKALRMAITARSYRDDGMVFDGEARGRRSVDRTNGGGVPGIRPSRWPISAIRRPAVLFSEIYRPE